MQVLNEAILKKVILLFLDTVAKIALFSSLGLKTLLSTALFCVFLDAL